MAHGYAIVRYHGNIYRIPKVPFETEEIAQDRAWFVAKRLDSSNHKDDAKSYETILNESIIYANKKYLQMEY